MQDFIKSEERSLALREVELKSAMSSMLFLIIFFCVSLGILLLVLTCIEVGRRKLLYEVRILAATFDSQDSIMITDENHLILNVNEAFTKMTGYSQHQVIGKNPRFLNSGRHDNAFFSAMFKSLLKDGSWNGEIWNKRKNGEVFPAAQTITAIKNDRHKTTRYVGVLRETTEQWITQEALLRSDKTFRAILENNPAAVRITSKSTGKVLLVNHAFCELIGEPAERAIGIDPRQFYVNQQHYNDILRDVNDGVVVRQKLVKLYNKLGVKWALASFMHLEFEGEPAYIGWLHDITMRKQLEDEVGRMAYYDLLTGLPNQRLFMNRLAQALVSVKRSGQNEALIFIDLDHFKPVNDAHGHDIGDAVLKEVAKRISSCMREMDTVARIGGDEFAILVGQLEGDEIKSISQVGMIAEKIRIALAKTYLVPLLNNETEQTIIECHCTASIGVEIFSGKAIDKEFILRNADAAMYIAKQGGGNRINFSGLPFQAFDDQADLGRGNFEKLKIQDEPLALISKPDALNNRGGAFGVSNEELFQATPNMTGYWDSGLVNRSSNNSYAIWFGTSPEALLGKHMQDLIGDELYRSNLPYIKAVLRGERQVFERKAIAHGENEARHYIAEYIPDIQDGDVQGFYVNAVDVTAIKRASQLAEDNAQKAAHTEDQMLASLTALSLARDNETGNHVIRTQHYIKAIATRLLEIGQYPDEINDQMIDLLFKAAPLHDIGKAGIPDLILKKSGKLSDEEWIIMKSHTTIGESILSAANPQFRGNINTINVALKIAGGHHEYWDGTGYPRGLVGVAIPLPARIMSVADVYDALVSKRVYKQEWTHEQAVQEVCSKSGSQFDPVIVNAFIAEQDAFREIAHRYVDA
jgi:diguanylate cyclase (GGDEF)-like protein/PAS domain S-box-containing protein